MIPDKLSSAFVLFGVVMGFGLLFAGYSLWRRLGGIGLSTLIMRFGGVFEVSAIEFSDEGWDSEASAVRVADGLFSWARHGELVASVPCADVTVSVTTSPRPAVNVVGPDGLDTSFVVDSVFPARWRTGTSGLRRQLRAAKGLSNASQSAARSARAASV